MKKIYLIILILFTSVVFAQEEQVGSDATEQTMYWIGGSGNWDDLSHWSFQSGSQGITLPSSIPTIRTHVIFDANSGLTGTGQADSRTVTIRSSGAIAKSLTFTSDLNAMNSPRIRSVFAPDLSVLTIEGNILLNSHVTLEIPLTSSPETGQNAEVSFNGCLLSNFFKEGNGKTIVNDQFPQDININVNEGELDYVSSVFNVKTLYLSGKLKLPNVPIVNIERIRDSGEAKLELKDTAIVNVYDWDYGGDFDPKQSEININGTLFRCNYGSQFNKVNFYGDISKLPNVRMNANGASIKELNVFIDVEADSQIQVSVDKLSLKSGVKFEMKNNSSFELKDQIVFLPSDCESVFYFTTSYGVSDFINSTGEDLLLDKGIFEFINFSSTTNNTTILEGVSNTGNFTTLTTPTSLNYYWTGAGDGENWNDLENWSNSPNGPTALCLPTYLDNVFIDVSSTLEIIIANTQAHVNNITISAPEFILNGLPINVRKSWYMSPNTKIYSTVNFISDVTDNHITSNSSVFTDVFFSGNGEWVLQDNFKTIGTEDSGNLNLLGGKLKTNKKDIYLSGKFSMSPGFQDADVYFDMQESEVSVDKSFHTFVYPPSSIISADLPGSHIIIRNAQELALSDEHIYKLTANNNPLSSIFFINFQSSINFDELTIYSSNVTVGNDMDMASDKLVTVENLKIIPELGSPKVVFYTNLTVNNFELGPFADIKFDKDLTFKILGDFNSNTLECSGLMNFGVIEKGPGDTFKFESVQNILLENVFLNGVVAVNNGSTYEATGINGEDNSGFIFTEQLPKKLYWLGAVDTNWNNPLNWTTDETGQSTINPCVPTLKDDVYFESFSGNGLAGLEVEILQSDAYFKNFYATNAPANFNFSGSSMISYGNEMHFGANSVFDLELLHLGSLTETETVFTSPNDDQIGIRRLNLKPKKANYVFQINNNFVFLDDFLNNNYGVFNIEDGAVVNLNNSNFSIKTLNIYNSSTVNVMFPISIRDLDLTSGVFNAPNTTITIVELYTGMYEQTELNIENSELHVENLRIGDSNQLTFKSSGSTIYLSGGLSVFVGFLDFNDIEVVEGGGYYKSINASQSTFNEIRMFSDFNINSDITTAKFFMAPRNLKLTLRKETTLTVTEDLFINGTNCKPNIIESDSFLIEYDSSLNPKIAYANPNDSNTFDFVNISRVDAVDADLLFEANSSLQETNEKIKYVPGSTTGVDGLGADNLCQTSYSILAYGFYGGPLSSYKWFKKNDQGVFEPLDVPLTTLSIDTRDFGLDGEYKVDMVYDATLPEGEQCKQTDTVTITFKPEIVEFVSNTLNYCIGDDKTLVDIPLSQKTLDFIQLSNAALEWYDAPTNGNLLSNSTVLGNGTYYASLKAINGCDSEERTAVTVSYHSVPISDAGPDQSGITGQTFTMQANNPLIGVGKWRVISGDVTITNSLSYDTTVTLNSGTFAKLVWEVDNNGCVVKDEVLIGALPKNIKKPRINPSLRTKVK